MALTDDQKARIEANRQKALQKRKVETSASVPTPPSKKPVAATFYGNNNPKEPPPKVDQTQIYRKDFSSTTSSATKSKVKGHCELISPETFLVRVGYHDGVINLFKATKSAQYHAKDRIWHFGLTDHDDLVRRLNDLRPEVTIDPLPKWIIKTFVKERKVKEKLDEESLRERIEPNLFDNLMPFQKDGIEFGLQRQGRMYLADDMGLGKTIQALGLASAYRDQWPMLVVCPSSVRFSWRDSVTRWIPSIPEDDITVITSGKDFLCSGQIVIISYDLLSRKEKEICERKYKVAIMDEAHFLKNHKSIRLKAAEKVLKYAERLILLSGTPALSRPIELYSQICLLLPRLFSYATDFGMRYCEGKKVQFGARSSHDFSGSSNMEELKILLDETCMIRRLKSDVLSQLPSKQREMIILDPASVKSKTKEMEAQAKKMGIKSLSSSERRGILLEWFNSTGKAKVKAVQDYVKDLLENGQKFIIFAHHQVMMESISEALQAKKVRYMRIDGNTSSEQRNKNCDQFQRDDNTKVALLSITAANAGLTLTAAHLVVFAELFWNPAFSHRPKIELTE